MMSQVPLPFIELFEMMRSALKPLGIELGLEQYEWLRRGLEHGFGQASWDGESIESWANLRRLARLLWVKPIPSWEVALKRFDRTFDAYRALYLDVVPLEESRVDENLPTTDRVNWPVIPPRKGSEVEQAQTGSVKTAVAFQGKTAAEMDSKSHDFVLTPQDLPLSLEQVRGNWRSLRQSVREGGNYELDLDRTVEQIVRRGFFDDVVMRPLAMRRAELVLLVDDSPGMVPFRRTIEPLVQAVEEGFISPGQIYRFTTYPDQYLFDWRRGSQAFAIDSLLARLHRSRTVMVVVSDAGAAMGIVRGERVMGSLAFVERAAAAVRQLIWLNPLPESRWQGTSAEVIARGIEGRMVGLDRFDAAALRSRELGGVLV
jgi:uncharacterized protein